MKFTDFIKDELSSILIQLVCVVILVLYLCSLSLQIDECILILISWGVVSLTFYLYKYYKISSVLRDWEATLENLDKKYLLGEMLNNQGSFRLAFFIEILRSSFRSMTQEVSKANREKKEYQELIEKWAHELKSPIASICLICENNPTDISRKVLLQANKLSYNIEQVLYYARLGCISNDNICQSVYLEDVIHTAIVNNKQLLIQNNFSVKIMNVNYIISTDIKILVFVLNQIINNSVQYKCDTPILQFHASEMANHICLEIEDNGIGIKESDIGRVFDKGFTGSNGRQKEHSTGIGLYLCKCLCDELGIKINISSTAGQYTRVTLLFPKTSFPITRK